MRIRITIVALATMAALVPVTASQAQITPTSVTVSWTTPGDDGASGRATQFDLRYSTAPIDASNFESATRFTPMPIPAASGTHQSVTVAGLQANTRYYFAIKTADEVPNWAPISNLISATTLIAPDTQRPAALAITVGATTDTTVALSWNAVGDDSLTGTATSYDVRYSNAPITLSNWASATQTSGEPAPAAPGTRQTFVVTGLSRQTTYYFAARVSDEAGNISALSNVPNVTTPDTMPPAAIRDLAVGWIYLGWRMAADRARPFAAR